MPRMHPEKSSKDVQCPKDQYEERLKEIDLKTLEQRRYSLDMVQIYKILTGKDNMKCDTWLQLARGAARATRLAADPLNIRQELARLETGRNFFTNHVVEARIPEELKMAKNVKGL